MSEINIKKTLKEVKDLKKTIIAEELVVKKRIESIFENKIDIKKFNGLKKNEKIRYSLLVLREISEMKKLNFINEDFSFMNILKGLFGNAFTGVIESGAEPIVDKVLIAIGFKSEGYLKKVVISLLTSRPSELVGAFGDCKMMTKLVSESLVEGIVMVAQEQTQSNSFVFNLIRNVLGDTLKDTSVISSIEEKLQTTICGLFSGFTDKAKIVADKLKPEIPNT